MSPELRTRLRDRFAWRGDRTDDSVFADLTGWWRDPDLLRDLGPALAGLFADTEPTVVLGLQSRGFIIGPLVAAALGIGFVEVRKDPRQLSDSDAWYRCTTPPDYRDRQLHLGFPRRLVGPADRVLLVDDWIATGGQAAGAHSLVTAAGARWLGAAVIVDSLSDNQARRRLGVRSLLLDRHISPYWTHPWLPARTPPRRRWLSGPRGRC
ncbi:phosphoribosyltransferase family protein [Actinokineospora auranticolor]|uniref:Adenine phosphoribosyltransferase n=1 Tax=Actinokineospora auranticolor TaxID=155976 RepID=A0A2S6H0W3_9PSEU|nr:phosphoribosyltransferase family protein [Actinokineospora auranticolor]PPK71122.1 adenine phosphoribosyltransferase [Actinokineospora auranticolor]